MLLYITAAYWHSHFSFTFPSLPLASNRCSWRTLLNVLRCICATVDTGYDPPVDDPLNSISVARDTHCSWMSSRLTRGWIPTVLRVQEVLTCAFIEIRFPESYGWFAVILAALFNILLRSLVDKYWRFTEISLASFFYRFLPWRWSRHVLPKRS